jgi:hypothetical protein
MAMPVPDGNPRDEVVRLERKIRGLLAAFNDAYMDDAMTFGEFRDLLDDITSGIPVIADQVAALDDDWRIRTMTACGFVLGSVEHHAQVEGLAPGEGLALVCGLTGLLRGLAGTHLPPRDTAMTFWIYNERLHGAEGLLRYTGDRGERHFNHAVNVVYKALDLANTASRALIAGEIEFGTAEGLQAVEALSDAIHDYQRAFHSFRHRDEEGQVPVTPTYFYGRFRVMLPKTVIAGRTWNGPNAAWLPPVFSFDTLLGTAQHWYAEYARSNYDYLSVDERSQVEVDIDSASVLDTLATTLGLPAGLGSVSAAELAARIEAKGEILVATAAVLAETFRTFNKGTRAHLGLVKTHLDDPAKDLTPDQIAKLPVKPDVGTGGGTRDLLGDIAEMRTACVSARALISAVGLLAANPNPEAA